MHPISEDPPLLLVEEERSLRSLFTDLLTEEGYTLACASSLEEAIRLVEHGRFALLLVDLGVSHPALDLQPLQALRSRSAPVPLALLTRLPLPAIAKQLEVAFVLPMPFDIDTCLHLIATTVNPPVNVEHQGQGSEGALIAVGVSKGSERF